MYTEDIKNKVKVLRLKGMTFKEVVEVIEYEDNLHLGLKTVWTWCKDITPNTRGLNEDIRMYDTEYCNRVYRKEEKARELVYDKAIMNSKVEDLILERVRDAIRKWNWPSFDTDAFRIDTKQEGKGELYIFISDLHYGRTSEQVIDSFKQILEYLNSVKDKYSKLVVFNLWDNIEWIVTMHPRQVQDNDVHWVQQLLDIVQILELFLTNAKQLFPEVEIVWVSKGNHDRGSVKWDDDAERFPWIILYEMLKKGLKWSGIKVEYSIPAVGKKVIWDINFIYHHWDGKFNKVKVDELLRLFWERGMYNVIISWHYHDHYLESWSDWCRVRVPSLNTQSKYEKYDFFMKGKMWFFTMDSDKNCSFISLKDKDES